VRDVKYAVPGVWTFVRCADCGLVYLVETLADPAQGYSSSYSQHRPPGRVRLEGRWSVRRDLRSLFLELEGYRQLPPRVVPRALARLALAVPQVRLRAAYSLLLVPPMRPSGKLLDIGCGNGRFLAVMSALGWQVHGIEPDERSAEIARQESGAQIGPALDATQYPGAYFDVITMNHALEHVADPVQVLRRCFGLCRPGGLIGVVVPNWRALGHRLFGRQWYALEPPRHAVMYEPVTLGRILERAGFHIESMRTTSVREWAIAWRKSSRSRTRRRSSPPALAAWGVLTWLASLTADDTGEEIVAWATRP
jgi:2-polyprenyl-3-methyl-5-hydroxy-6-metoxy-1,4-benzoquinol methylase